MRYEKKVQKYIFHHSHHDHHDHHIHNYFRYKIVGRNTERPTLTNRL